MEGRLAPGDKVPSRHELAREYEVSDRVAVEAVRLLVAEGYVESRSGSGTYVRRRPQVRRLTRSWYRESRGGSPFRADMASQGPTGSWRASSETATAPPAIAERLGVPEGAEVMRTRYTFLADDEPAMLSTSWEPLDITRGTPVMLPEEGPHAGAGVVARMRAIGVEVGLATEVVTPRAILAEEAAPSGRAHRDDRDGQPAHVLRGAARRDGRHHRPGRPLRAGLHHPCGLIARRLLRRLSHLVARLFAERIDGMYTLSV
ncbi:GntR family transcriptional regulator [Actinomadura sp. NBRC 104412]|uniref:GntR family transcriptional regulator n=1 Tax=Actinomadura sp. NBRC 104412 TaxID=3032203 RepID=UPI0024A2BEF0|nr:GntR family transcriptional regulator [Actinomadura sp. NBRC 104412]GLZ04044.1 GntR family transcriptional regulator [Actinomadura sp. NBRC 104412]